MMNLLEIRTEFIRRSGRYDLVVDAVSFVDNGANFYINSGQRFLDRLDTLPKSTGRHFTEVESGRNYAIFPYCRAIKEVWAMTTSGRTKLAKKEMSDLREYYADGVSSLTGGTPLYYAPAVMRVIPESDRLAIGEFEGILDFADVMFDKHYEYNGVVFYPPPDETYVIEVWGLFYSPTLDTDLQESFWSVVHPEILLMAAMHQLEIMYRNTEGAKDWLAAITGEVSGLGKDFVEEHIAEVSQMEG
jgi:hypothetical protein